MRFISGKLHSASKFLIYILRREGESLQGEFFGAERLVKKIPNGYCRNRRRNARTWQSVNFTIFYENTGFYLEPTPEDMFITLNATPCSREICNLQRGPFPCPPQFPLWQEGGRWITFCGKRGVITQGEGRFRSQKIRTRTPLLRSKPGKFSFSLESLIIKRGIITVFLRLDRIFRGILKNISFVVKFLKKG
jgi:hypothetical protein